MENSINDKYDTLRNMCYLIAEIDNVTSRDDIANIALTKLRGFTTSVTDESIFKRVYNSILDDDSIKAEQSTSVQDENVTPWLKERKSTIDFALWERFKKFMKQDDHSFPIDGLDDSTDKVLDKCIDPTTRGSWDRRGMVVGHVQSGKTSNYIGLINKATDAGYKLIIVLAGSTSSLRRQTQERIDLGYMGIDSSNSNFNTSRGKAIGVGKFTCKTSITSLTSSSYSIGDEGDFNDAVANRINIPLGESPIVLVIKKNKSILENLITWLGKNSKTQEIDKFPRLMGVPTLIIDDEADNASVNATKDIDSVKTINKLIRTLVTLFDQSTFIGYTATPYANLFISQDFNEELTTTLKGRKYKIGEDLFPKDFIVNLKTPNNYIGATAVFGYENPNSGNNKEPLDIFRDIDDYEPPFYSPINKNNKNKLPTYIPESLKLAIKNFIITCAIRSVRHQQSKDNSMLVHVAHLVKWIDRVSSLVHEYLRELKDAIIAKDPSLLYELEQIFLNDFKPTTENILENLQYRDSSIQIHEWSTVQKELNHIIQKIEVRAVHGTKSTSELEFDGIEEIDYNLYKEGLYVIAVGGNRLSRGITLKGLSISYFLRTSKMYDSLMQMGRWFGYRPGYVDLCRIFTTSEIFNWFNHINLATEEMRNDFDEIAASLKRPKDFNLKVRNHQGLLTITSLSKLNFSDKINISFSGTNPQTYQFNKDKETITANFKCLEQLIQQIGISQKNIIHSKSGEIKHLLYKDQDISAICDFINDYKTEQPSIVNSVIVDYITKQKQTRVINSWNICIVSNTDKRVFIDEEGNAPKGERQANKDVTKYKLTYQGKSFELGCNVRNQKKSTRHSPFYLLPNNQIDSIQDRQVDLNFNEHKSNKEIKQARAEENKGLIIIYALDPRGTVNANFENAPIIGYSIHFPKIENEKQITYTITSNKFIEEDIEDSNDEN